MHYDLQNEFILHTTYLIANDQCKLFFFCVYHSEMVRMNLPL